MNVFVALLDMEVLQKLRSHFAGWFKNPCKKHTYTDLNVCLWFMIIKKTIITDCILLDSPDNKKNGQFYNTQTFFSLEQNQWTSESKLGSVTLT